MKLESFIGAFSSVYLANASGAFQQVYATRYDGVECDHGMERRYVQFLASYVQSGPCTVTATINFYGVGDQVYKIADGVPLSGEANDPLNNSVYELLCIYSSKTESRSFYFPRVSVTSSNSFKASKKEPSGISITFSFQEPNPDYKLVIKGSLPELASLLGSRFPVFF